jgi:beta-N-acetylhexosaminidase
MKICLKKLFVFLISFATSGLYGQEIIVKKDSSDTYLHCDGIIFTLQDYNSDCVKQKADSIFYTLSDAQRLGQLIVVAYGKYGYSASMINTMLAKNQLGGILMLNGYKAEFKKQILAFNESNRGIPILYSADAEPSLINQKIKGTTPVVKTNQIYSSNICTTVASVINNELKEIGILHNFAPVIDYSNNKKVIGNRSFGISNENVKYLSQEFITQSTTDNVLTTLKHFPGHGMVSGDSHIEEVYIDGDMKELKNFHVLASHCQSIMMGHIVLRNNDYSFLNYPASCNRKLITELIRNEWNYDGLIITDALNMAAAQKIKNVELEAIKAGADMILMPKNVESTLYQLTMLYQSDALMSMQIDNSIKRILRIKICLGIL